MQVLHRLVLRPITFSPPTVRVLRRNRWQPASTNFSSRISVVMFRFLGLWPLYLAAFAVATQ